ncbi:hypothetical protein CBR_g11095 [Chara braunii]|uniref:Peptidase S1 domain-containing protein n=1 Tax=Chara braunii TaxID=69332 RepID=A0A388KQ52_CHABU|nr:hypothetical protein CBR_g11095 [Chara braunii]|eukprot:GBG72162.1 hypothetical protein CBR_g11095 [Chara braunii]
MAAIGESDFSWALTSFPGDEEGRLCSERSRGRKLDGGRLWLSLLLSPLTLLPKLSLLLLLIVGSTSLASSSAKPLSSPAEGNRQIARRKAIVNGQTVAPAEQAYFAFHASISLLYPNGTEEDHFCGGSIIAPSYILTAAHCFDDSQFNVSSGQNHWKLNTNPNAAEGVYSVLAGTMDVTKFESAQVRVASELWIHKDYVLSVVNDTRPGHTKFRMSDDLAILKLAEPLRFSDTVRSIALSADDSSLRVNTDLTLTGFGSISTRLGPFPTKLQVVTVDHLPDVCARTLENEGYKEVPDLFLNTSFYYDHRKMICAGCADGGTGACPGDSGGPLFALSSRGGCPVQVGVTSWGMHLLGLICAVPGLPEVYARVSHSVAWIESIVGQPVRSTVPLSPTTHCENCLANDFPDGKNCPTASRYDIKLCDVQARLASSFVFSTPTCSNDGKWHILKASIDFFEGFPNLSEDLKNEMRKGRVVFLYTEEGTGDGTIKLPQSIVKAREVINTPLKKPKVLAKSIWFNHKEDAWVYRSPGCSADRTRSYAALYVGNPDPDKGMHRYLQISMAVGKVVHAL